MPIFTPVVAWIHGALCIGWAFALTVKFDLFKQVRSQVHKKLGGEDSYKHPKLQGYWLGFVGVQLIAAAVADVMVSSVESIAQAQVYYYQQFTITICMTLLFMAEYTKDSKNKFALGVGLLYMGLYLLFTVSHLLDGGSFLLSLVNLGVWGGFGYLVWMQAGGDVQKIKDMSALEKTLQLVKKVINEKRGIKAGAPSGHSGDADDDDSVATEDKKTD